MAPKSLLSLAVAALDKWPLPQPLTTLDIRTKSSIKVLRTCLRPDIDIVCVPDKTEDPLTAWNHNDELKGVNWLTDLLPITFPQARILLFRRDPRTITINNWVWSITIDEAYELLILLWKKRKGRAERRPLLFLTHGSGALLARSALIQASAGLVGRSGHLRPIYLSCGSVVNFDTSRKHETLSRSWKDVLDKVSQTLPPLAANNAHSRRKPADKLKWQQDRFKAIRSTITTTTIVTNDSPRVEDEAGSQIVDAAAAYEAMRFLDDHARIEQLPRSGMDLLKYENIDDPDYCAMVGYLHHSMEVGKASAKAKWEADKLRESSTPTRGEDSVLEVGIEDQPRLGPIADLALHRMYGDDDADVDVEIREEYSNVRFLYAEAIREFGAFRGMPKSDKATELKNLTAARLNLRLIEASRGVLHPETLKYLEFVGHAHFQVGMLAAAESILQRLLVSLESLFGMRSASERNCLRQIGLVQRRRGDNYAATSYFQKVIDLRLKRIGYLEDVLSEMLSKPQGDQDIRQVEKLSKQLADHLDVIAIDRIELAVSYTNTNRFNKAEFLYTQVLDSRPEVMDETRLLCLKRQAEHWSTAGKYSKAIAAWEALVVIYKDLLPEKRLDMGWAEFRLRNLREYVDLHA